MRAPRTRFAAPFVAIVAAGCSAGKGGGQGGGSQPTSEWAIRAAGSGSGCFAEVQVCDRCNPPAPIPMACPAGVKTDGSVHIVTFDGKTCSLDGKPIDCPTYDSAPPPPPISIDAAAAPADDIARVWNLSRDPHGGCSYFQDSCSHMTRAPGEPIPPCNPPPSKPIACPPYVDPTMGAEVVQHKDGTCTVAATSAHVDCLP